MLFTSLTSTVGFLSLMLTPIPPVQIFGAFVALGILLAFLVTIVFIPAYVVRMKPESLAGLARLGGGEQTAIRRWPGCCADAGRLRFRPCKLIIGDRPGR